MDNDLFDSQDQFQGLFLGMFGLSDYILIIILLTLGLFLSITKIGKLHTTKIYMIKILSRIKFLVIETLKGGYYKSADNSFSLICLFMLVIIYSLCFYSNDWSMNEEIQTFSIQQPSNVGNKNPETSSINYKYVFEIVAVTLVIILAAGLRFWYLPKLRDTSNTTTTSDSSSTSTNSIASTESDNSYLGSVEKDNSETSELALTELTEEERVNAIVEAIIVPAVRRANGNLSQCLIDNLLLTGDFEAQLKWLGYFFHRYSPTDLEDFRMAIIHQWIKCITYEIIPGSPASVVLQGLKIAIKMQYDIDL